MKQESLNIYIDKNYNSKYFTLISMISITLLISAMIFTYRIIKIGYCITPGGVIPFTSTYLIAAMVAEVYGYENAKKMAFILPLVKSIDGIIDHFTK